MTLPVQPNDPEHLASSLRQEAAFRVQAIRDFKALEARLRSNQETIDALNQTLGEKDTYIHSLHLAAQRHAEEVAAVRSEVERYAFLVQGLTRSLSWIRKPWLRAIVRALLRFENDALPEETLPAGGDLYHLDPSPFRVYTAPQFRLAGWVRPAEGRSVALIRARIGAQTFRPDAAVTPAKGPHESALIDIAIEVPVGHSLLRLEVADVDGVWRSLLNAPLWRPHP